MSRHGLAILALLTFATAAIAQPIYVSPGGSPSANGSSWDDAVDSITLGAAFAEASGATQVWVAAGEYRETVEMKSGIAVLGGFDTDDVTADERTPWANETVIHGGAVDQCVVAANGAAIDGFTIRTGATGPTGGGGGIANLGTNFLVSNCTFLQNNAGFGGALWNFQGTTTLVNCLLIENQSNFGGAVYNSFGVVNLVNCTIVENSVGNGSGILHNQSGAIAILNSILFANNGSIAVGSEDATLSVANSIVHGQNAGAIAGDNVINELPGFFASLNDDYRLAPDSPAIDAGVPADYETAYDLRGLARVNGDAIDLGAIEFHLDDASDADGDGIGDMQEGTDDPDGDFVPNYLDEDSNGNGVDDVLEGGDDIDGDGIANFLDDDADGNGLDTEAEGTGDTDQDGIPDIVDTDNDGDGIPDIAEGILDADGDGTVNMNDTDADGDGIGDRQEGASDMDGDGLPNFLDLDSDGDGESDAEEGEGDDDGDGIPNFVDEDNDVPMMMSDVNIDGSLDASDIQAVINAVLGL